MKTIFVVLSFLLATTACAGESSVSAEVFEAKCHYPKPVKGDWVWPHEWDDGDVEEFGVVDKVAYDGDKIAVTLNFPTNGRRTVGCAVIHDDGIKRS